MKSNRLIIALVFIALIANSSYAQTNSQTIRGTVVDKITQVPITDAVIKLLENNANTAVSTDINGTFNLGKINIGKVSLSVSYIGYNTVLLNNLTLNAGKELVLKIEMEESIIQTKELLVEANSAKEKALNELSIVSARTFSVEETQKFAAAVNDPGRMATSFAGVVSGNDGNNIISVRGNSPNGLLWRMEGVEIPNPNHFSSVGSSGGGISILSAQLLSNSDFISGAFAAEYGNATSGVFDLRLRKGNNEKREVTLQAGFLGLDAAIEGPFKKGYAGSYLVNYRYSTLGLISKMGVNIGDASTIFQDLSYNISLPTAKMGQFSLFGFGGISKQTTTASNDTNAWKDDSFKQYNSTFYANTGATGATHNYILNSKTLIKSVFLASNAGNGYVQTKLNNNFQDVEDYKEDYSQNKLTLSTQLNYKYNSKLSSRSGVIVNRLGFNFYNQFLDTQSKQLKTVLDKKGYAYTIQAYSQISYKVNSRLTINPGVHYLTLLSNNSHSIEPRISAKIKLNAKQSITMGYGIHGQVLPLGTYFTDVVDINGNTSKPNQNLKLSKASHYVIGYDILPATNYHFKVELYYQLLQHIGVATNSTSTYSIINEVQGYPNQALVSTGLGKNKGIELTAERFLSNNFYALLSASLFDSKYKAPNGNWYNTRFNTNYAFSFTSGKEWTIGKSENPKTLGLNIKTLYTGGLRETPLNLEASKVINEAVYDYSKTNTDKVPDYFRTDLRLSLKKNYKKATGTFAIDIQNVSNRKNVGGRYFDIKSLTIKTWNQSPLVPIFSYKLEF